MSQFTASAHAFSDPTGASFQVLQFGRIHPHSPAFTDAHGLLIPSEYIMRRQLGGVLFEGAIRAERVGGLSSSPPSPASDLGLLPAFSITAHTASAAHVYGPRGTDGALLSCDGVWAIALRAHSPANVSYCRAVGGLGMFGLTTSDVQRRLCELAAQETHVDLAGAF